MTTQNMKLLDLQTGKYLELGKEWVYGGEHIIVSKCNIGYEVYEAIQHNNSEKLYAYDNDYLITEELNEQLKALCEETGAVVYGGRYVLLFSEQDTSIHDDNHCYKNGDVVSDGRRHGYVAICTASTHYSYHQNVLDIPNFQDSCDAGFLSSKYEMLGNIFEEYSKQLRNEPNQFDELNQHFK